MKIYIWPQNRGIVQRLYLCLCLILILPSCSSHKTVQKENVQEIKAEPLEKTPAEKLNPVETLPQQSGEKTGKISGRIIDNETGEPLPGVQVFVRGTNLGAVTDIEGEFVILNVPAGQHELETNYLGFASNRRSITVVADQKIEADFEIKQVAVVADEIRIEVEKDESDAPIVVEKKPEEPVHQSDRAPASVEPNLLDEMLELMPEGNIAFNTPPAMNIEETATVQLVLDLSKSIAELQESIAAAGEKEGARIKVAADAEMEAKLVSSHFEITPITPEIQPISRRLSTNWKWDIKPKSTGDHALHLTLNAVIKLEGEKSTRLIKTFDRTLKVQVTLGQKLAGFFTKNWQWLWAVLVVPVAGWLWKKFRQPAAVATE